MKSPLREYQDRSAWLRTLTPEQRKVHDKIVSRWNLALLASVVPVFGWFILFKSLLLIFLPVAVWAFGLTRICGVERELGLK